MFGVEQIKAAVAKLSEFKERMCACKNKDCAQQVNDEMTKWSNAMAKEQAMKAPDADATKQVSELATQMGDCMAKAMTTP